DANLPKRADGSLEAHAAQPLLELIASDIARNLDVWDEQTPIAPPVAHARVDLDDAAVDFDLDYRIVSPGNRFSARLNTFRSLTQPVRTIAQIVRPDGATRTFSVIGSPQRVYFDPSWAQTARRFAALAAQRLLEANQLWFLFALVVPFRKFGTVATSFA